MGLQTKKEWARLTEKMETGPLKRSDITIAKSDSQRGPARTQQLGMQSHAFKGDLFSKNDLFAISAQTVTTISDRHHDLAELHVRLQIAVRLDDLVERKGPVDDRP